MEWNPGQATGMAGHDMNDWHVCLWYDHHDSAKAEREANLRKPRQSVYIIGPSARKSTARALGLTFIEFLRGAGVHLLATENPDTFIRGSPS